MKIKSTCFHIYVDKNLRLYKSFGKKTKYGKIILSKSQVCKIHVMIYLHFQDLSFVLDSKRCHDGKICYRLDRIFYPILYIDKYDFSCKLELQNSILQYHYNKRIHELKIFQLLDKSHKCYLTYTLIALTTNPYEVNIFAKIKRDCFCS